MVKIIKTRKEIAAALRDHRILSQFDGNKRVTIMNVSGIYILIGYIENINCLEETFKTFATLAKYLETLKRMPGTWTFSIK